jgi:hypothetical protein
MKLEKTCKIHGVLEEKDIRQYFDSKYKIGYSLRCRICNNERAFRDGLKCKTHGKLNREDIKTNGRCKKCHRQSVKKSIDKDRDGFNAILREKIKQDKANNPEKWKEKYKKMYAGKVAKYGKHELNSKEILRMHKLTGEQYDQMIQDQDNRCGICLKEETRPSRTKGKVTRLSVDHCHTTNKVRGLLCYKCNLMIGYALDSPDILYSAIMYLESHEHKE